jgi:hypothetical protein
MVRVYLSGLIDTIPDYLIVIYLTVMFPPLLESQTSPAYPQMDASEHYPRFISLHVLSQNQFDYLPVIVRVPQ